MRFTSIGESHGHNVQPETLGVVFHNRERVLEVVFTIAKSHWDWNLVPVAHTKKAVKIFQKCPSKPVPLGHPTKSNENQTPLELSVGWAYAIVLL